MRMSYLTSMVAVVVVAALQFACSSTPTQEETNVDARVSDQRPADMPGELAVRGYEAFVNSTSFTPEQKEKLVTIHTKTYEQASLLRDEISKTKSALFKTLATPNYSAKEVSILKKKIEKLDQKRLATMFKAIDDVEKVIGRSQESEKVYQRFMNEPDRL